MIRLINSELDNSVRPIKKKQEGLDVEIQTGPCFPTPSCASDLTRTIHDDIWTWKSTFMTNCLSIFCRWPLHIPKHYLSDPFCIFCFYCPHTHTDQSQVIGSLRLLGQGKPKSIVCCRHLCTLHALNGKQRAFQHPLSRWKSFRAFWGIVFVGCV